MDNGRSYQQQLVAKRLHDNWEKTLKYNDDLDKRATLITSASSIVVGIVAAAKFLPNHSSSFSVESVLLGVVCLCSVVMYWYAIQVWRTSLKAMPGTTDVMALYEQYIALSEDEAYNNGLIDLSHALSECVAENERKAGMVEKVVRVLQVQVALLGVAIAWSGISSLWVSVNG